jgi:hypothetical protein
MNVLRVVLVSYLLVPNMALASSADTPLLIISPSARQPVTRPKPVTASSKEKRTTPLELPAPPMSVSLHEKQPHQGLWRKWWFWTGVGLGAALVGGGGWYLLHNSQRDVMVTATWH